MMDELSDVQPVALGAVNERTVRLGLRIEPGDCERIREILAKRKPTEALFRFPLRKQPHFRWERPQDSGAVTLLVGFNWPPLTGSCPDEEVFYTRITKWSRGAMQYALAIFHEYDPCVQVDEVRDLQFGRLLLSASWASLHFPDMSAELSVPVPLPQYLP